MCLYPQLKRNKRYTPNKKNGGLVPPLLLDKDGKPDKRLLYVPIACGRCMVCMKKKGREWTVRLLEEIRNNPNATFVTLTFNTEALKKLAIGISDKIEGYDLDNEIAKKAVKLFRERWRRDTGKSPKHWLITEMGGGRYEHLHLHGIIWGEKDREEKIIKHWREFKDNGQGITDYGYVYLGKYVNEKTAGYITKYMLKRDDKHKEYTPIILTSAGIGKGYLKTIDKRNNIYNGEKTDETYKTKTGNKLALPIYWRNKIYTEEQREKLWQMKLDKNEQWIGGQKVKADDFKLVAKLLQQERDKSKRMGYNEGKINWDLKKYENERRNTIRKKRIGK